MSGEQADKSPSPVPPAAGSPAAAETSTGILPAAHWTEQEIPDDADSALGDDVSSSTASLATSILEYRTVLGRTFHSDRVTDNQYWGPNDEKQSESADVIHHALLLVLDGKLTAAPIPKDIKKVLDIGTGTGSWAMDFADEYPACEVIGTDISPIQPGWVPPNLRFEIEDASAPWTFPSDSFDFVHMRYLFGSFSDWNALYREAYRVTKPGGWIESFEASSQFTADDGTVPEGSPMHQWGKVYDEAGKKFGRSFSVIDDNVQVPGIEAAGFVDLKVIDGKLPLNGWMKDPKWKEVGQFAQLALEQDIEGYVLFVWTQVMGWTPEETKVFIAHFRKQLRDRNCHSYFKYRIVTARKPE
ncbi:S-adenosyl-L-methionine-dependent methyltransferase [Cercophora newfieldiana]|uniref:S-adenosyl-L-methionine-dependent methyltransferase n=1 Tax=Cercophora newfieldiana TaxID=92897 RepID=A0AA39YDY9_9PEZI|nr:S-adenosyl-L-methionine-dependent methyltransferase [Cercophora newfieldiana]